MIWQSSWWSCGEPIPVRQTVSEFPNSLFLGFGSTISGARRIPLPSPALGPASACPICLSPDRVTLSHTPTLASAHMWISPGVGVVRARRPGLLSAAHFDSTPVFFLSSRWAAARPQSPNRYLTKNRCSDIMPTELMFYAHRARVRNGLRR